MISFGGPKSGVTFSTYALVSVDRRNALGVFYPCNFKGFRTQNCITNMLGRKPRKTPSKALRVYQQGRPSLSLHAWKANHTRMRQYHFCSESLQQIGDHHLRFLDNSAT